LSPGNDNFGLYFQDQQQLDKAREALGDHFKISALADLQPDGRYQDRSGEFKPLVGHNMAEPHLMADGSLE
jgi:hypothetical protein